MSSSTISKKPKSSISSSSITKPLEPDSLLVLTETLNTLTHGVGAFFALVCGSYMVFRAYSNQLPILITFSLAIFSISLFTLMSSSCAYHAMFRNPYLHARLRRLDHCSIFFLIAGSYTPFMTYYASNTRGIIVLSAVWMCAIAGAVKSLLGTASNKGRAFSALFTGWIGIFALPTMKKHMQHGALIGVFAGGIVYSIGIVFYLIGKKRPLFHVVWHIAVIIGGAAHYFTLLKYVVNRSPQVGLDYL